ncbi:alpha-galactosidase A [Tothia fuscella]|uniref:Alpha-galactosidase A n=1 Tax=Tothia fuscella TaxID=1048955 RepID=A0A9P4TXS1_9PEZI|nr:alpha-galactosidase A [Tothia fuscella]
MRSSELHSNHMETLEYNNHMKTHEHDTVPQSDSEVLNQLIDDERGVYRVRAGTKVHYLHIPTTVFDDDIMCRPYLLIPRLPALPATDWTTMRISRGTDGALESTITFEPLPAVLELWHPRSIDILSLKRTKRYRSAVHEDIERIKRETWIYSILSQDHQRYPDINRVGPEFLAHLTENGRVIGLLLEKIEGGFASVENLPGCKAALQELHDLGLVHGDVNRYNFIIDPTTSRVRIVDFEHAEGFDEEKARVEMASLPAELAEETDRGKANVIDL